MSIPNLQFPGEWTPDEVDELNARFEDATADEILAWTADEFGDDAALASSFGLEDVVLVDLIARAELPIRIFTLDTGRLHQETYDVIDRCRKQYGVDVEVYFPRFGAVQKLVREQGPNGFYESRRQRQDCCHVRKVEPLGRALSSCRAWITGLRRDQNVTRHNTPKIELDRAHGGILKINPLADWSADDIDEHIDSRGVPYNELHDRGFPSIGCAPCTRPVEDGEDVRAGRWWWEEPESKECGLHTD